MLRNSSAYLVFIMSLFLHLFHVFINKILSFTSTLCAEISIIDFLHRSVYIIFLVSHLIPCTNELYQAIMNKTTYAHMHSQAYIALDIYIYMLIQSIYSYHICSMKNDLEKISIFVTLYVMYIATGKPSKRGHFGNNIIIYNINSERLSFVEKSSPRRFYALFLQENKFGMKALLLVERFLIQCPCLRMSSIGSFPITTFHESQNWI